MNDRLRLILLSFLMLFVELTMIRWTGSRVVYLSYFSNFVLLGSFLGIGLGFLRAERARNLFPFAPMALAALVAFIVAFPVDIRLGGGDLLFFGGLDTSGPPRELVLTVIFLVVAAAMMFVGEGVARVFVTFEPLEAYKLDLLGSVLGIVAFSLLSFLRVPPIGWGIVVAALLVLLCMPRIGWAQIVPLVVLLGLLGAESLDANASWSPYYKITVKEEPALHNALMVYVNSVPHQVHQRADAAPGQLVYELARPASLANVLVIGAGGGNDVSVALQHGARHVDAVEIDPRLYDLGKSRHPDHPYQDPKVDAHIDDGRAFLERTSKKYDLILLALPDSITLVSGQSSLRLESYLFTKEALASARDHLEPGGVFAMYNYYREVWLADRFANTLTEVYGKPPCELSRGDASNRLAFFAASNDSTALTCDAPWQASVDKVPPPATDDHPFPYLRTRSLPTLYLGAIALMLLFSVIAVRSVGGPLRPMTSYIDLFFMGAAFLLIETKNVVQFALLFGTTWFVNAIVFAGVLLSVLVAVAVSRRVTFRRPARLYLLLLASLVVAWFVPQHSLLALDAAPRFFAAVAIAFFPIFVANLVFTQRFKDTASSVTAFGANLLGAMVGGLIEYSALIIGYRMLLVVAGALYALAFLFGRRHLHDHTASPAGASAGAIS